METISVGNNPHIKVNESLTSQGGPHEPDSVT